MAMHSKTKKYQTYGRKRSRIVDVAASFPVKDDDLILATPKKAASSSTMPSSALQRSGKQKGVSLTSYLTASLLMSTATKPRLKHASVETVSSMDEPIVKPIKKTKGKGKKVISSSDDSESEGDFQGNSATSSPLAPRRVNVPRTRQTLSDDVGKKAIKDTLQVPTPEKRKSRKTTAQTVAPIEHNKAEQTAETKEAVQTTPIPDSAWSTSLALKSIPSIKANPIQSRSSATLDLNPPIQRTRRPAIIISSSENTSDEETRRAPPTKNTQRRSSRKATVNVFSDAVTTERSIEAIPTTKKEADAKLGATKTTKRPSKKSDTASHSPEPTLFVRRPPVIVEEASPKVILPISISYACPLPELSQIQPTSELERLLHQCGQERPYNFSSFVDRAHASGLLSGRPAHQSYPWRKLGEASYSEVFEALVDGKRLVIKVVPLFQSEAKSTDAFEDMPQETKIADASRELEITRLLNDGNGLSGFVKLSGAYIVDGCYPLPLLKEWDDYLQQNNTLIFAATFSSKQAYLLLCLPYSGQDLETFHLSSWRQAVSILSQVASALASAERIWKFEHRDLHWGNILIQPTIMNHGNGTPDRRNNHGLQICIIDFTLSSSDDGQQGRFFGGFDEEELFEGEGDVQFDIYRKMRAVTKGDWEKFCPATNLMWLWYLVDKLLTSKQLRPVPALPTPRAATPVKRNSFAFPRSSIGGGRARKQPQISRDVFKHDPRDRQAYEMLLLAEDTLSRTMEQHLECATNDRKSQKRRPDIQSTESFVAWWEGVMRALQ